MRAHVLLAAAAALLGAISCDSGATAFGVGGRAGAGPSAPPPTVSPVITRQDGAHNGNPFSPRFNVTCTVGNLGSAPGPVRVVAQVHRRSGTMEQQRVEVMGPGDQRDLAFEFGVDVVETDLRYQCAAHAQ